MEGQDKNHGEEGTGRPSGFLGPSLALPWTLCDLKQDTSLPGLSFLICTLRMKVRLCGEVLEMV